MKHETAILVAAVGLGLLLPGSAGANTDSKRRAQTFELVPTGVNRVTFESDAPIENIVGITSAVTGQLVIDLRRPAREPAARVVVALDQLKTGIAKRDEHMRSAEFLDTAKYPEAVFALKRVAIEGGLVGKTNVAAKLYGTFTLRGVTRNLSLDVRVSHRVATPAMEKLGIKGDVLRIKGAFSIELSDYGIEVPSKLGAKLSNTVEINLALTAFTG